MVVFEWVLGILLVCVLLSALARKLHIPYLTLLRRQPERAHGR
jgi:hypothetical protein